jgi:iron complex transport system ATP-binding protein
MTIEITNAVFGYDSTRQILKGISLSCRNNRITGIIGPNGCGKTTTLKVMAGFLHPASGKVRYDNQDISSISSKDAAKMRAVVEQTVSSPFGFPVYDYVMLGRSPYFRAFEPEHESDHSIVLKAMEQAHVTHLADKKVNALSGGELQRIMIARALAQEPAYLLLDEPTSHLDIRQQLELMQLLKTLCNQMSIVMVIHELNHASLYCDDIILMKDGGIIDQGETESVLDAKNLESVFEVIAFQNPEPGSSRYQYSFTLPPVKCQNSSLRIHVMSGGGSGRLVLMILSAAGYPVSAGAYNIGDMDYSVAQQLGIDTIIISPFTSVSRNEKQEIITHLKAADVIVVVEMDVGQGNMRNLQAVADLAVEKTVYFVGDPSRLQAHDYTGGSAIDLYNEILKTAKVVPDVYTLLAELSAI